MQTKGETASKRDHSQFKSDMCVVAESFAAGQLLSQQSSRTRWTKPKLLNYLFCLVLTRFWRDACGLHCIHFVAFMSNQCKYSTRQRHSRHTSLNAPIPFDCFHFFISFQKKPMFCYSGFVHRLHSGVNREIRCFSLVLLNNIVLPSILNRITRIENRSQ